MPDKKENTSLLRAEGIHKWFGKVHALRGFDFEIKEGEGVGLLGDNGAGKSTFAKIISGVIPKNRGKIYWKGDEVTINSIEDARGLGIETVYQEQALVSDLSVAKNIFLGRAETTYGPLRVLKSNVMEKESREIIQELGLRMPPSQEVRFCSGGERQGVAVARAFYFRANLVILDEPTRALSSKGVERILGFIRQLKEKGIAVILISHVFPQIFPVTDRFVVLSQGQKVAEKMHEETSVDELTNMIIEKSR